MYSGNGASRDTSYRCLICLTRVILLALITVDFITIPGLQIVFTPAVLGVICIKVYRNVFESEIDEQGI